MKKYKKLLLKSPPFKTGKNLEWGGGTWNVELHELQFSWDGENFFNEKRFGTSIVCKTEDSENHVYSTILRSYEDALKQFNERYENPMKFLTA
tara:strand:+ start:625 stop:903 length:279 start_codon:yes stop_codon:yes gene_type:complete